MRLWIFLIMACIAGCTFSFDKLEFRRAESAAEKKDYPEAVEGYHRMIKRFQESPQALEAARRGAKLSTLETKDYVKAVDFYKHLVMYSDDPKERLEAQKRVATIYFENLTNYPVAIEEYSKLIKLQPQAPESFDFRLNIAKSYFQMNKFDQARIETDELLEKTLDQDQKFDVMMFKGNLLLTEKKLDEAILVFNQIKTQFKEKALKENVGLTIAVCYEEKGDFNKAIDVLQSLRETYSPPEFIDFKIARLKERQQNQPGASGLKR